MSGLSLALPILKPLRGLSHLSLLCVVGMGCLLFSTKKATQLHAVQISKVLTIQSSLRSPARQAFDSLFSRRPVEARNPARFVLLQTHLDSGDELSIAGHRLFLEPLRISRADFEESKSEQTAQSDSVELTRPLPEQAQLAKVLREKTEEESAVQLQKDRGQRETELMNGLTESQRLLVARAQMQNPNFLEEATLKSTEEILQEKAESLAAQIGPAMGATAAVVSAGDGVDHRRPFQQASHQQEKSAAHQASYQVQGEINIPAGAGVAMLNGFSLEVYWLNEGVVQATGTVDHDYKYGITITELSGYVVARLYDHGGKVVASAQKRLSPIDSSKKLQTAHLELRNRNQVEVAYRGLKKKQPIYLLNGATGDEHETSENNQMLEGIREDSIVGIRGASSGYYPMLGISRAGQKKELGFFTTKTVETLLEIINQETLASTRPQNNSIVWGKLTLEGKPVEGVRVELEGFPDEKALYFNNAFEAFYFPNRELQASSQNGLFAFAHLPRGVYAVKAYRGETFFGHGVVEVDDRTLSSLDIQGTRLRYHAHVKAFDAFAGNALAAHVELQSLEKGLRVDGYARPALPANSQFAFFQATFESSEYLPTQGSYSNDNEAILIPGIQTEWVRQVQQSQRVSYVPETGIIVVFTPTKIQAVSLPHNETGRAQYTQIVYFDAQGVPSRESSAGGGFLIFNVESGSQTVVVEETSGMLNSVYLPITPGWASAAKLNF